MVYVVEKSSSSISAQSSAQCDTDQQGLPDSDGSLRVPMSVTTDTAQPGTRSGQIRTVITNSLSSFGGPKQGNRELHLIA